MATCKVSAKVVLKEASDMVLQIDQDRAIETNKMINSAMQRKRWFSRKPQFETHTEALRDLRGSQDLQDIEITCESQRDHCLRLSFLCSATITYGDGSGFIELNENDISMLGFGSQQHFIHALTKA